MPNYSTPDVYVEEIATLPPSIAEVSTAIPAFLGYTKNPDLLNVPTRITSLLDYKSFFGGPETATYTVTLDTTQTVGSIVRDAAKKNKLYYALDHYFKNGGGDCYVISIGDYNKAADAADFTKGLAALAKEDEPTLIVLAEAANLLEAGAYYGVCQDALTQCALLQDRFCILDVKGNDVNKEVADFRDNIPSNLNYGAAYYPNLVTSLNYVIDDADVSIRGLNATSQTGTSTNVVFSKDLGAIKVNYSGIFSDNPSIVVEKGTAANDVVITIKDKTVTIGNVGKDGKIASLIDTAWSTVKDTPEFKQFSIVVNDATGTVVPSANSPLLTVSSQSSANTTLSSIKQTNSALYNNIKLELNKQKVVLPPSPAIAGAYATTDRTRGVWKAPANVGLNAVISPTIKISASDLGGLNIDTKSGKSINAIRSFTGKGTMVWGARTLAGNDNEWRYVSVRRLFIMIEESARKASSFAVFEPNDATTWLKVKGMIDSYLYGLWQQGALAGSSPKAAFYVHVGLGTTMTTQDVLEGRMNIEIGIAAVRPAEFIILRFSHKLQEA